MGGLISKAANGIGTVIGNTFAAPIKTVFGASCEGVCVGTWDLVCFIEHLCVSNLVKLLMVFVLAYITLLFVYLLFKLGIIPCIVKSLCKMGWAACEAYWFAIEDISCFLWYKLKNTKRVYRGRRFQDLEEGYSSCEDDDDDESYGTLRNNRRRERSVRERRKDRVRRSLYPVRRESKYNWHGSQSHHHHDVQWRRSEVSVCVNGKSGRRVKSLRQLQVRKGGDVYKGKVRIFKKRRLR